jgi:RimJ/RimL family protein N-acetyltransferase
VDGVKSIVIRKAVPEDAANLITLMNVAGGETDFLSFGGGAINMPIEAESRYIQNILNNSTCLMLVAEVDGEIAGMLDFCSVPRERVKHCGEFGMMVKKSFWGIGIGRRLLKEMLSWAKGTGIIRKINLKVREGNTRAMELYRRMGFKDQGFSSRELLIDGIFYGVYFMGIEID